MAAENTKVHLTPWLVIRLQFVRTLYYFYSIIIIIIPLVLNHLRVISGLLSLSLRYAETMIQVLGSPVMGSIGCDNPLDGALF